MIVEWNKDKYKFYDVYNLGYPYYFIHPIKQREVRYLIDNIADYIDYVFIFGSSVHTWHFFDSDLDVCFVGNRPIKVDYSSFYPDCVCDFIWCDDVERIKNASIDNFGSIYHDVLDEGVLVYVKKS